jgi:hypothetical protein
MDQPQPRSDFVAFLNRDKQPGDRRPAVGILLDQPCGLWAGSQIAPVVGPVRRPRGHPN